MRRHWQILRAKLSIPMVLLTTNGKRQGSKNAIFGMVDYLSLPIGMLLAAPFLLRHLGSSQYGIWVLAGSAVSSGNLISGGFGDALIKYVGHCRGQNNFPGIERIVRSMISINLMLSGVLASALWYLTPYVAHHIVGSDISLKIICVQSLRIGSLLLVVKSVEGVFISTLRAFETYGPTAGIAIASRITAIVSAVMLTRHERNVVWIMIATLIISILGLLSQAVVLRNKIGHFTPLPSWDQKVVSTVVAFGSFSWVQAISGVVLNQADRFFIGFIMGAPAVAYYSLCVQAAQPIHGLISSGMHFIFPHLSARYSIIPISRIRHKVASALKINILLVVLFSLPLIIFGKSFLALWMGKAFSQQSELIFQIIVCSFALLGMNVTAHYTLLAVGQVKNVTYLNLLAGAIMLLCMANLVPKYGLSGAAFARLLFGPITCLTYIRMHKVIWNHGLNEISPQPLQRIPMKVGNEY
jgi:O-antigen/teichoic acid export membrane protein